MSDDNFSAEELAELGFETEAELEAWVGPADDEQGQAILDGIASLITDSALLSFKNVAGLMKETIGVNYNTLGGLIDIRTEVPGMDVGTAWMDGFIAAVVAAGLHNRQ